MTTIAIRNAAYRQAADEAYAANHGMADSYLMMSGHLNGYAAMAGTDDTGAKFAESYDDAASSAMSSYATLVSAVGGIAHLADASRQNHGRANRASTIDETYSAGDPYPSEHEVVRVDSVTPPSALGGDGAGPDWWHWVADKVGGLLYPDADTDKLRQAGSRWRQEADQIATFVQHMMYAADGLEQQDSPEASLAVATCQEMLGHIQTMSESFRTLGDACDGFATDVEDHRQQMEDELQSFIAWTIGIQVASHGLAIVTVGISELVGQSAQVAKIAAAAAKVRNILAALSVATVLRLTPIAKAATAVTKIAAEVRPLVTASARMAKVRAVGAAGEKAAGITKNTRRIDSVTKPGKYRIPDQLDDAGQVIGEVKNVKYQGLTSQLRDFLNYADTRPGWTFVLYVRQGTGTTLSGPLQALVDAGKIVVRRTL